MPRPGFAPLSTAVGLAVVALAGAVASPRVSAAEGMWVPQQLPEISAQLRAAGLKVPTQQLSELTGDPLGAVVSLGGCTASFVSEQGLVATNHHCAYGAIQLNSTPQRNLMQDGFYAAQKGGELSAGPNARVYVLEDIRDVTDQVKAAIAAAPDALGRSKAQEDVTKRLIAQCEEAPGFRCRLYSFAGGGTYRLFRNLEIKDVRLVYAPPGSVGNYGGEVDNWMWPRHTGDFAFYRAYVGPDGRPAAYAENNVPYRPKRWLKIADKPLNVGDFVMVAGYPGRTNRYALTDEFLAAADWSYPTISRHYKALVGMIDTQGAKTPDIAVKYANLARGMENTLKNYDGQLAGFKRIEAEAAKRKEEEEVLAWLRKRGKDGEAALQAHESLRTLSAQRTATRERDLVFAQLDRMTLLGTAAELYRAAIERQKVDAERRSGYQERDFASLEGMMRQIERRYHPAMDRELTRYWLNEYVRLPKAQRVAEIDKWLGGSDQKAVDKAVRGLEKTLLGATDERLRWLKASPRDFERSKDPAIRYAVAAMPALLRLERAEDMQDGDALLARPAYLQALADYRASKRQGVYPDANGSLRITFGKVTGYTDAAGTRHQPFTRLEEVAAKATGKEPFDAPQALLDAVAAKRYGGLADKRLGTVPVNFLSDLDITGGNSGSPVLNAQGRLVGLAFDGNWESVASNWVYDGGMNRMISVDQRYMRWIMQEVYPAPELLRELGVPAGK